MSNGQSNATFDPDEYMKKRQRGGGAPDPLADFDPDEYMQQKTAAPAPEDEGPAEPVEPTEEEYPGLTAKGLENIRQGAKARPKTEFEKQRPDQEWYGFTPSHLAGEIWEGAKAVPKFLGGLAYDTAFGELNPDTGEIEHGPGALIPGMDTKGGIHPWDRANALAQKYYAKPVISEWDKGDVSALPSWDKRTEVGPLPGLGHRAAAVMAAAPVSPISLLAPVGADLAEQAGSGDPGGATGRALGMFAGGELMAEGPEAARQVGAKVFKNVPFTGAGKIEQAVRQLLAVRPPGVNETEYRIRLQQAVRDLQDVASRYQGRINGPRDFRNALNDRINQIENPIGEHLAGVNLQVFPDQYLPLVNQYMDEALADIPGALTPKEKLAAKQKVLDFLRDPMNPDAPKMGEDLEGNRRRLNDDADKFYKADTAGKNSIDVSDATAIAQRAAADAIRDYLYGKDGQVGFLERSGLKAFDDNGQQISFRDVRKRVGNLLEIRNHMEKAIVRAEQTGDWSAFGQMNKGPSLAAGGAGALFGLAKGKPLTGVAVGEAAKAAGSYRNPTNINELTKRAVENLARTAPGTTPAITVQRPGQIAPPQFGQGGQGAIPPNLAYSPVQGPPPAPGPFQFGTPPGGGPQAGGPSTAPGGSLWQQQVGSLPPLESGGPTSPFREPIGPQEPPTAPVEPITGPQLELGLPEARHELFNLPQTPMVPAPPEGPGQFPSAQGAPPAGEIQGPARDIRRNPATGRMEVFPPRTMQTTEAEYLRVGNTFVDDKGDPRRITEISKSGKIKTADDTMRDYTGEIQHQGEINSPQARTAQGGKFHPEGEPVEGEAPKKKGPPTLGELLRGEEGTLDLSKFIPISEDEPDIVTAKEGSPSSEDIEKGTWFLNADGSWIGSPNRATSPYPKHEQVADFIDEDQNPIRVGDSNAFDLTGPFGGGDRPSNKQISEMARIFRQSGQKDLAWALPTSGEGEGSFADFAQAIRREYPEAPVPQGEIGGAPDLGEIGGTQAAIRASAAAADTRVSRAEAADSLRQKENRAEDIGQPENEHLGPRILEDDKGKYSVGRLNPDQFIDRIKAQHTPEELKLWRAWYDDIGQIFADKWGTGVEGARKFMGWLLSQQRASPSVGMGSVFRVEDMMKGQPKIKAGGLAEAKIRAMLGGLPISKGLKAKLNDFADSALGKTTRTWMGDNPRGGMPAAIDVWAARGAGYFDQVMIDYIKKRFGDKAAEGLVADFRGAPSAQQYERASEYYNGMAEELNRRNFDGGGWTPAQVQAVDWGAVGKQQGRHMELPKEILGKNVRRIAYEVDPGFGSTLQTKFPPLSALDPLKAAAITKDVAEHVLQIVMKEAGGYIHHKVYAPGGWTDMLHGQKTQLNPSAIVDVLGSPEAAERVMNGIGYLLQQGKVYGSRVMGKSTGHAFEIREVGGNKLADPATVEKFWIKFNQLYPKAEGFQPVRDPNGTVGMQILKERGHYSEKIEIPKMTAAANAAADSVGIPEIDVVHHEAEVRSATNDWAKQKNGEAYLDRLKQLGTKGIVDRMKNEYAPSVLRRMRQAWMEHAMDEWRAWAMKQ